MGWPTFDEVSYPTTLGAIWGKKYSEMWNREMGFGNSKFSRHLKQASQMVQLPFDTLNMSTNLTVDRLVEQGEIRTNLT